MPAEGRESCENPGMHASRHILRLLLGLSLSSVLLAQSGAVPAQGPAAAPAGAPPIPASWRQGFASRVSGEWIVYPWAYPGQTQTLLSRATDGQMAVEWLAEAVPPGEPDDPVTYLWHAGTASGYGAHRFTLSVNGRTIATFTSGRTTADQWWTVSGEGGAQVSFRTTRVGQFNELFGFMWLTAPRSLFGAGAPRFRVVGEAAGSQDYYLGPQQPVKNWTRVHAEEALFRDGQHVITVGFSHVGSAAPAQVRCGGAVVWTGTVEPGYTAVRVPGGPNVPSVVPMAVTVGDATTFTGPLTLNVVRARAIHVLPHSHVDIGYSDPQPEVERKQWKNLRDAVELGAKTATNPPEARFKWNVEGLWSVESYLAQASPQERTAFAAAVRAGTIGLQANYTNILTGLATPGELRRWTDAARRVRALLGVGPIRSAMHSDIPGLSWTVVAALAESGVRYLSSGPNYVPGLPDGGDRIGGTLRALGDKPFWWMSPSGEERLLFWMAGRGYSWFHGINAGRVSDQNRNAILEYVASLVDEGYRYDMIQVRYTIGGDNGPVDPGLPDFVKAWNREFSTPKLVINTSGAMFEEFERRYGATLPIRAGDMTPYWEDGALSTAAEETSVRAAARRVQQAETLAVLRGVALPAQDRDAAWRNVILWREHTWGAADSISQPDRPDVVAQWEFKRRFATEADRLSRVLLTTALPAGDSSATHVDVINTLAWPRSGLVIIPAADSRAGDRAQLVTQVPGATGRTAAGAAPADVGGSTAPERDVPSQRLKDGRLAVWLEHVPALSSVRLRIVQGQPLPPHGAAARATDTSLDNGRVKLVIDGVRGAAMGLSWSGAPGHDFSSGAPGLLRYFYVDGRDPSRAAGFGGGRVNVEDDGPLVAAVRVEGRPGGTAAAAVRMMVVAGSDLVFADVSLDKLAVRGKESAHVAFPFNVPGGVMRADQGEAFVEIERDQLPGSCRDFIGVQSAIDVSGPSRGITLISLDTPLIELGAMTDEQLNGRHARSWREHVAPGTTLYAYLLNNYWHTNYKADQQGPLVYRFVLRPHGGFDPVAVRRLGDEQDYPLLTVPAATSAPGLDAPFVVDGDPIVVSSVRHADLGRSIVIRLYNPTAKPALTTIRAATAGSAIAVLGGATTVPAPGGRVTVPPLAIRTVRLSIPR